MLARRRAMVWSVRKRCALRASVPLCEICRLQWDVETVSHRGTEARRLERRSIAVTPARE